MRRPCADSSPVFRIKTKKTKRSTRLCSVNRYCASRSFSHGISPRRAPHEMMGSHPPPTKPHLKSKRPFQREASRLAALEAECVPHWGNTPSVCVCGRALQIWWFGMGGGGVRHSLQTGRLHLAPPKKKKKKTRAHHGTLRGPEGV